MGVFILSLSGCVYYKTLKIQQPSKIDLEQVAATKSIVLLNKGYGYSRATSLALVFSGGGGAGGAPNDRGTAGTANTGGGGGGASYNLINGVGVAGGSGIVILSYEPTSIANALPNIEDGSIFYETDTNKSYVLNSGTWTEV